MAEINDEVLRALFDVAVSSMDFGSGFLDDEEVHALREVAGILGVDPAEGTPANFRCKYRGHHEAKPYLDLQIFVAWADGRRKNVYPVRADGKLVQERGRQLGMFCPDCGRTWQVFEDTTWYD